MILDLRPELRSYRTSHRAIHTAFFLTGLVFGTWAARVPAIKSALGLTEADLAVAFAALNGGAIVGLHLGAVIVARFGSRAALRVSLPAFALLLPPLAMAPNLTLLAIALALSAAVNGVVDVAINVNGVAVERRCGRAVLSRLHAMLTLGGITGAAAGAAAASLADGLLAHFGIVSAVATGAAVLSSAGLIKEPASTGRPPTPSKRPTGPRAGWFLAVGGLAFCVTLAEGSANDWAAVYLDHIGAGNALAAIGLATFLAAMTLGRLAGDNLRGRFGDVALFRGGAVTAAVGLGASLLFGDPAAGLAGFALLGLGLSVTLPVALGAASHGAADAGRSAGAAVARVSTVAYLGSFVGPPLIGVLATANSLGTALLLPALLVAIAALFAGVLETRSR